MKKFALIGVGGYIAPRHLAAIKETGNILVAALDKNDSVGILDRFFPDAHFFTEFERFDRHLEMLRRKPSRAVDYVSICSPNYLHDAHIRFALRIRANAICEKPLVLNPWNVTGLRTIEMETGKKVNAILQLRLHPTIKALKAKMESSSRNICDIDVTYITPRGRWYLNSWKGDIAKSGGLVTNIGIHFFDMLIWVFGAVKSSVLHRLEKTRATGFLELERARVRWFLSLNAKDLPFEPIPGQPRAYRSIRINGEELEFSTGFTDLHIESYKEILAGRGFGLDDVMPSIKLVSEIRNAEPVEAKEDYHPLLTSIESLG